MRTACGIDFGSTYLKISWYDQGNNRVIPIEMVNASGARSLRSVVYYPQDGTPIVGDSAWNAAQQHPARAVIGIKRSMGTDHRFATPERIGCSPEQVLAEILKVLVQEAKSFLGERVTEVVITVPAYFGENECVATRKAGEMAGLTVLELMKEAHAVALGYAIEGAVNIAGRDLLVYDLGGRTFDVALIHAESFHHQLHSSAGGHEKEHPVFEMVTLCTEGNTRLGGLDWDKALAGIVAEKILKQHGVDVALDPKSVAFLNDNCEKAKRYLGRTPSCTIVADLAGHSVEVSRREFENQTQGLLFHSECLVEQILKDAVPILQERANLTDRLDLTQLDLASVKAHVDVMVAGGSSKMPMVGKMLRRVTGREPLSYGNPELLASIGAAYQAFRLSESEPRSICSSPAGESDRGNICTSPPARMVAPTKTIGDNVQFTVFRPHVIAPRKWYPLLAFAHLSERRSDAQPDEPDPLQEVQRQAMQTLGEQLHNYRHVTHDSIKSVPEEGELTFVPEISGIEFNPSRATFLWLESVHRQDFRLRAVPELDGQTARGRLTVFLGMRIVADVALVIRVSAEAGLRSGPQATEAASARPYRKVFASYSHEDAAVVDQFEQIVTTFGDRYLRDSLTLRAGEIWSDRLAEMIREADVFQLFWSSNSMGSTFVRQEWEHALSLNRQNFVRPVYWEKPLPENRTLGLPTEALRRLHFQSLGPPRDSAGMCVPADSPQPPTMGPSSNPLRSSERLQNGTLKAKRGGSDNHPTLATSYSNLATVEKALGNLPEAEEFRRALEGLLKISAAIGRPHPSLQTFVGNYAGCLKKMGRSPEQITNSLNELYQHYGVDIGRTVEDPDDVASLASLADQLDNTGRGEEATPLRLRIVEIQERILGPDHRDTLRALNQYTYSIRKRGRAELAEPFDQKLLASTIRALGEDAPLTIHRRNNLVLSLVMLGRLEEARAGLDLNLKAKAPLQANTSPRVWYLEFLVDHIENRLTARPLGRLKTFLLGEPVPNHPEIQVPWDAGYFLEAIKAKVPADTFPFLLALVAALNDRANVVKLDEFPAWREAKPEPLN